MTTITINEHTKKGKRLLQFLETLKDESFLTFADDLPYSKKFVDKIRQSEKEEKEGKVTRINTDDLWK